ncbi:NAD(P)-dependent oxidoreductase [Lysinimonas soli]|uniref:NAD(P)-dependent oxidoreductase n=1 Tax=Lysinimonas soli TaxID=1074233 RepID=A0ABW0NN85_9MICO
MSEAVGLVGLGAMGARMARRLVAAGHPVTAWARDPARAALLAGDGVVFVATPRDVAEGCSTVVGCLLDDEAIRSVYGGGDGLIAGAGPGQVFVEHGTFSPDLARELSALLSAAGAAFIDAPVTGGPEGAEAGTLVAMAGGDRHTVDSRRTLFADYLASVHHIGASGSGLRLKLVNQLLVSVHMAGAVEAAALLRSESIPLDAALPVLMGGWAASAMLERELPRAMREDFASTGAAIQGLVPVQDLVARQFESAGISSRVFPAVREMFRDAVACGFGADDPARLLDLYRRDGS